MWKQLVAATAFVAVAATSAFAGLTVTHANVSHTYAYDISNPPNEGTIQVLNSSSTGNAFTTFDGETGVTSTLSPSGGSVKVNIFGNATMSNDPHLSGVTGSIQFDVTGGSLSVVNGVFSGSGDYVGQFELKNLASGQSWIRGINTFPPGAPFTTTGTLSLPTGPGTYELNFSGSMSRRVGTAWPTAYELQFAVTPEPATLSVIGGSFAIGLRRRR